MSRSRDSFSEFLLASPVVGINEVSRKNVVRMSVCHTYYNFRIPRDLLEIFFTKERM